MVIQYIFKKIPDPDSMSLSDHDDEDEYPVEISYDDPVDATCKAIYLLMTLWFTPNLLILKGGMFNLERLRGEQRTMMETSL